ncbi:cytochrome P450 [Mycolicibacterium sp. 050158]|uniref:cytochrome P450 n=1 Tax=Mycolicibacterium sp. 050158 TaxID=3090602 RepID=UPI00299F38DF|nr:cytochrome P450 [Mycolicibacterium sp. 050158]MDX1892059.1 cytochrome P450 [Mycolicibacterium sp. 050158]
MTVSSQIAAARRPLRDALLLGRRAPYGVPGYAPDVYGPGAIADPYPHYAALRELGPVVWLEKQRVYAVARHAEVKYVLLHPDSFVSGRGVALNSPTNRMSRGTTLNSDGQVHERRRKMLAHRLTPRALRSMREQVQQAAREVVDRAMGLARVDGVEDLALGLPLTIVPDLIGWPRDGRDNLVTWAGATFDLLGPLNRQAVVALPAAAGMKWFTAKVARRGSFAPGSLGHELNVARDSRSIDGAQLRAFMIDYLAPSIDTTAGAIAAALWLFACHRDQWELLKADRSLLSNAVNEVVRIEAPLRSFSRWVIEDTEISGVPVCRGARVNVFYASANRDAAVFTDPDSFDITRNAAAQLGFGLGVHGCAGQGLARLETESILEALLDRVEYIEVAGVPKLASNNIIHRFERLPLRLVPGRNNGAGGVL